MKLLPAMAAALSALAAQAQVAEPILAKTALPFTAGSAGLEFDFATGIGAKVNSQIIPETTLEAGISSRLEAVLRFPLLRIDAPRGSEIGGGQLAFGGRFLLAGGANRRFAISMQAILEAPTGDSRLVGNATQIIPGLLVDWRLPRQLALYSNLVVDDSVSGSGPHFVFVEFQAAVTLRKFRRLVPVLEIAGSTNALTGRTQVVAQPEIIVRAAKQFEIKAGFQRGLNAAAPANGVRAQLAWFWGNRNP